MYKKCYWFKTKYTQKYYLVKIILIKGLQMVTFKATNIKNNIKNILLQNNSIYIVN